MAQIEFSYYIPPDTIINDDGTIDDMSGVYSFDNYDTLKLMSFTGYGMPPINYITQQGPFQHGQSVIDYRLQPRVIQLVHYRRGGCRQDYWDNRSDLINFLRPNRQTANSFEPGRLRQTLPDGTVRDLKVFIDSGPKFNPRSTDVWNELAFEETLRFVAYDPILFNPAQQEQSWVLESLDNLIFYESPDWTDRAVFPIWFGGEVLLETTDVTYNGTWLSYPKIFITGPLDGPRITNLTTDKKIELDYNISAGEVVTIDLEYGQKTITNNFGTNLIGTATTDSDIAEFAIVPSPEATDGVNTLTVLGANANLGQTEIKLTYNENYIGI